MTNNEISLIGVLTVAALLPLILASGSCYLKFSIVLVLVRNALGIQQVPSNLALNSIALIMSLFVMMPVTERAYHFLQDHQVDVMDRQSLDDFVENGLGDYKRYLQRYSDPELVKFFESVQSGRIRNRKDEGDRDSGRTADNLSDNSLFALVPAYALSEIKSAFRVGFYLYLPFVVVDMVVSTVLLALGMMMMSPVSISVPIKLILFVAIDGWTHICKDLVMQYVQLMK
ncbi:type III secretion apparatus YscR/HrcR family protein [Paraburkholderia youngii]|uniref:EscR/YscR/HrcR family type III secretion system export apparatus protein n=1 Tax=Paraburkholderia youngii TaxID=2782701 RepID=UPI003D1FDAB6